MSIKTLEKIANLKTLHAVRSFQSRVNSAWLSGGISTELYLECRKYAAHQAYILKKRNLAEVTDFD